MDVVLTPCSHTPISVKDKWKTPLYVREYHRLKRREKHPPKQRLRIADDGKLVVEHNPDLLNSYYTKRPRRECVACGKAIYEGSWERHMESQTHANNMAIYERGLRTNPVRHEIKPQAPIFHNNRYH